MINFRSKKLVRKGLIDWHERDGVIKNTIELVGREAVLDHGPMRLRAADAEIENQLPHASADHWVEGFVALTDRRIVWCAIEAGSWQPVGEQLSIRFSEIVGYSVSRRLGTADLFVERRDGGTFRFNGGQMFAAVLWNALFEAVPEGSKRGGVAANGLVRKREQNGSWVRNWYVGVFAVLLLVGLVVSGVLEEQEAREERQGREDAFLEAFYDTDIGSAVQAEGDEHEELLLEAAHATCEGFDSGDSFQEQVGVITSDLRTEYPDYDIESMVSRVQIQMVLSVEELCPEHIDALEGADIPASVYIVLDEAAECLDGEMPSTMNMLECNGLIEPGE